MHLVRSNDIIEVMSEGQWFKLQHPSKKLAESCRGSLIVVLNNHLKAKIKAIYLIIYTIHSFAVGGGG